MSRSNKSINTKKERNKIKTLNKYAINNVLPQNDFKTLKCYQQKYVFQIS